MPSFDFRFLICSYLPGVPLSVTIYYLFLEPVWKCQASKDYFTAYIIISPIIIGLFIDGLRHLMEFKWKFWKGTVDGIIELEKKERKDFIISYYATMVDIYYHMYEYFSNIMLSLFLSVVVMLIKPIQDMDWFRASIAICLALIIISAIFAWVFIQEHEEFKNKIKQTKHGSPSEQEKAQNTT